MKAKQKPGVVFQPQVHQALKRGITTMVNAIRPTLGPNASGIAIDNLNKSNPLPEYLDSGGVIARRIIELPDRNEDMGAMLVRSMVTRQHDYIGDGTATAAVLFEAIFSGGLRYIVAGGNAMQFRQHLQAALPIVLNELDRMASRLEGERALTLMAESLCHDAEMAALIGEAFDVLGEYGRLEVREDYGRVLRKEFVEGSYFHTGLFARTLAPENAAGVVRFEDAAIFLCDFEVENYHDLFPVLQTANEAEISRLVIIARNLSEGAIGLLVANNKLDKFKVAAVQLPGHNPDDRMDILNDLAALTGASPFIAATGDTLAKVDAKHFGTARRFWADARAFSLVGGGGDARALKRYLGVLKERYHNMREVADRQKIGTRIGNLLGGALTLWVGGFTETEINSRKALAERTVLAMRGAMDDGVVPGGGVALLKCRAALDQKRSPGEHADQYAAYRVLADALAAPARTIFRNAGYEPSAVLAQLDVDAPDTGFDVISGRIVNICDAGILDSIQVIKASVRNAVSTAALALTIDSLVHVANPEMMKNPHDSSK